MEIANVTAQPDSDLQLNFKRALSFNEDSLGQYDCVSSTGSVQILIHLKVVDQLPPIFLLKS